MLETLDLEASCAKEAFKEARQTWRDRLYAAAHGCWIAKIPVLVILEGWDASGKSDCIRFLTDRQDPRGFRVEYFAPPTEDEGRYPWLRRFWLRLPKQGQLGIFDTSWYRRLLQERVCGDVQDTASAVRDIVKTERMLAADGMIVLKFLLHISKEEQRHRLQHLEKHPQPGAVVTHDEWGRHEEYEELLAAAEDMLTQTDNEAAPWHLVAATDSRYMRLRVIRILVETLESALAERRNEV